MRSASHYPRLSWWGPKKRREWEERMEKLNDKYGLDYYSSSDSGSDWEEEPRYETLV